MQRNLGQQEVNLALQTIIYLGLIPFDWNEENLRAVVCSLGPVLDIHFSMDHYGKNKGYAFIEYQTPQQAQNAIAVLLKSQVKNPMTGYFRRFKADLSKEPNKNANIPNRQPLALNPAAMPIGMQFPPDFVPQNPIIAPITSADSFNGIDPQQQQYGQQQRPGMVNASPAPPPPPPPSINLAKTIDVPEKFLKATELLPVPMKLPFTTPDKISETLALLPPVELIQLIANLKVMLNNGEVNRAAEVFQLSPQLAAAASQALLLMGFIDEAVIQETMKSGGALPQVAAPAAQPNSNFQRSFTPNQYTTGPPQPVPQQEYNRNNYGQPLLNFGQQQNFSQPQNLGQQQNFNNRQNFQQQGHQNTPPPPQNYRAQGNYGRGFNQQQVHMQGNNQMPPPPQMSQPQTQGRWSNLPPSTQAKLANLPPNDANVIADILSMPMEQFNLLDQERKSVILNLRQQYM